MESSEAPAEDVRKRPSLLGRYPRVSDRDRKAETRTGLGAARGDWGGQPRRAA